MSENENELLELMTCHLFPNSSTAVDEISSVVVLNAIKKAFKELDVRLSIEKMDFDPDFVLAARIDGERIFTVERNWLVRCCWWRFRTWGRYHLVYPTGYDCIGVSTFSHCFRVLRGEIDRPHLSVLDSKKR